MAPIETRIVSGQSALRPSPGASRSTVAGGIKARTKQISVLSSSFNDASSLRGSLKSSATHNLMGRRHFNSRQTLVAKKNNLKRQGDKKESSGTAR